MRPNKNYVRVLIVLSILLALYCVLVFVIPFERGTVFWLSFVFTLIAILGQIYILKSAFRHGEGLKSKFYGFPIARVGVIYLSVQFVFGLLFMALGKWIPVWGAVTVCVVILGLAAIGIITTDAVRDEVERQETRKKEDTNFITSLRLEVTQLSSRCGNPEAKRALEKLEEEIRFSDPVSNAASSAIEDNIRMQINELLSATDNDYPEVIVELANRLTQDIQTRNRQIKSSKQ